MGFSLATRRRRLQRGPTRGPRLADPPTVIGGAAADYTLFLVVMAALGASFALARGMNHGPGLVGDDSLHYVATAQGLLAGKGFSDSLGTIYIGWPPLYPLALAVAAGLTGVDPLDVAGPLNAAVFGLTVFAAGRWLRRRLGSRFLAAWAAAALVFSVPLVDEASWAVSEPLFILMTVLALIHADAFLAAGKTRSLLAAAACGALAWQVRYIGAVVPVFVGLLLLCRGGGFHRRIRGAAVVWLAAGLSTAPWMLRNYFLDGFFSEPRPAGGYPLSDALRDLIRMTGLVPAHPEDYSLPDVLRDIGGMTWQWLHFELPGIGLQPPTLLSPRPIAKYDYLKQSMGGLQPPELFSLAGAVWAAAAAAAACWILLRFPWKKQTFAAWRPLWVFGGCALLYLVVLAAVMALEYVDIILHPRYVTPAYIPLLLAAVFALDRLGRAGRGGRESAGRRAASRLPAAAAMTALCLWTAGQAAPHARRIARTNAGVQGGDLDTGVSGDYFIETLRYVRANPLEGTVYVKGSTLLPAMYNPDAAYRILRDAPDIALLEGGVAGAGPAAVAAAEREQLQAKLAAAPDGAWVVWFKDAPQDNLIGLGEAWLSVSPLLEPAVDLADGVIYRVRKDAPPRANPYRAALEAAAPPVESGEWRVESGTPSLAGGELVYIKEACSAEEVRARFMLHVYPADAADLPRARRRSGYGFDNLSFYFPEHGVFLEDACVVLYPLPDYAIERIETGQLGSVQGAAWKTALRAAAGGSTGQRAAGR